MAYIRVHLLFVLTLLQLCRAEISSIPESWYSANVINDGYHPKPISEIFSTESPFSSTNPIIVLPKQYSSVPNEISLLSTLQPPRKISTTGSSSEDFAKTSVIPLPSSTPLPPTIQTIYDTFSLSTLQTTPSTLATFSTSQTPQLPQIVTQFTKPTQAPSQPVFAIQPELLQTTLSVPQPNEQQSTLAQPQLPSQIRLDIGPQGQLVPVRNQPAQIASTQQQQSQSSTVGPQSNYFFIYQQAPQSVQGLPGPVGSSQEVPQLTTDVQGSTTPSPSTVIVQSGPTVSSSSTTPFPSTTRVTTTQPASTTCNCQNTTFIPTTPKPQLSPLGVSFPLSIRVVAPSGSITNVNFNPISRTTTTRTPTTTRTRRTNRPRKNNYETCTDGCRGRREPICSAPLSVTFLDPNTLKGFPSVCHMACHNSYRKEPYEKVMDGRCGRLRTRIRTVDSNTKLKRNELNKAQYFLDNSGTKTIVEFSPLN